MPLQQYEVFVLKITFTVRADNRRDEWMKHCTVLRRVVVERSFVTRILFDFSMNIKTITFIYER